MGIPVGFLPLSSFAVFSRGLFAFLFRYLKWFIKKKNAVIVAIVGSIKNQ